MPRPGFDDYMAEVQASGGKLGGAWAPYDPGTFCPTLCQWLVSIFPVRTVLDVGCGFGAHLKLFRSLGCQAIGIEGMRYAADRCGCPVIVHDLEASPLRLAGIDLAFSVEAAEHIANWSSFLATMCVAPVVVFSAAQPGAHGHHHVNCQTTEWWVARMQEWGYTHFDKLTKIARAAPLGGGYVGMSVMVYARTTDIGRLGLNVGGFDPE